MPSYWLHALRQESTEALTIALSSIPVQDGSPVPTANYGSWDQLETALLAVGITVSVLQDAGRSLTADGFCTFADIPLTHKQLATLGFAQEHLAA